MLHPQRMRVRAQLVMRSWGRQAAWQRALQAEASQAQSRADSTQPQSAPTESPGLAPNASATKQGEQGKRCAQFEQLKVPSRGTAPVVVSTSSLRGCGVWIPYAPKALEYES